MSSWGPKWGEDGYIRISRKRINNCGVSQQGYYPVLPNAVETDQMRDKFSVDSVPGTGTGTGTELERD